MRDKEIGRQRKEIYIEIGRVKVRETELGEWDTDMHFIHIRERYILLSGKSRH